MKIGLGLALLAGLVLATGLIAYEGAGQVFGTLVMLGWGFVPFALVHAAQILCCAAGWRPLIERPWPRAYGLLLRTRWLRESVNNMLPVAHVGGEIVGARMLSFRGVRGDVAGASIVVDITVEVVTQALFTLLCLALLFLDGRGTANIGDVAMGVVAAIVVAGGFVAAQRFGLFKLIEAGLDRAMGKAQWLPFGGLKGLHDAIQAIHRRPKALAVAACWHFAAWMLGGLEVWLAFYFMGLGIGVREALILEGLGQAARTAAFAVPGALGIQEGGFLLFGAMLGIAPGPALALSLAKRLRELAFGLPGVAVWQWLEGRRLLAARGKTAPSEN